MKITYEQIKQLASQHTNDAMLGAAVRKLVNSNNNINEISMDPQQRSLLDEINEITQQDGHRY